MRASDRRGFTLLELIIALGLIGFVMLGGILLLDQLGDSVTRIGSDAQLAAREGNGERILRSLLLDATTGADTTQFVRGDQHAVEFTTRCATPGGWRAPCRATLSIDTRPDSSLLIASLSTGEGFTLLREPGRAELRYRRDNDTDSLWLRHWSSTTRFPPALALVSPTDTIVLPMSAR